MTRPVLSLADVLASAVSTTARPADLRTADRHAVALGAHERAQTMAAAATAGLLHVQVLDSRCGRTMTVLRFIRHCADVDHIIRDVAPASDELFERDLGRQGESRTAVAS